MKNPTMGKSEWFFLVLLSILWGGTFFFNEIILRELEPFALVLTRAAIAAVILLIIVYATGRKMPSSPAVWGAFAIMGAVNNLIPHTLIVWGQQYIDSGLASILNATAPLFAVGLTHFLTSEETLTPNRLIGILMGLTGAIVLIGPDALSSQVTSQVSTAHVNVENVIGLGTQGIAQLAVLTAACCYALAGIYGRRFRGMPPIIPAAGMLTSTALMTLPIALLTGQLPRADARLATWGALIGLGVLSTAVAYRLYYRVLKTAGATNVLLVTFLIPVSALLLGVFVLGERVDRTLFLGMALIFAGLVAVDGRLMRLSSVLRRPRLQ